jgi:LysM repeat protein
MLRAIGWVLLAAAGIVFPLAVLAAYDVSGSSSPEPFQAGFWGIAATVDIDPQTLNPGSQGRFVTAYIELPEGYDVADIDVSTVTLKIEGAYDSVPAELSPTEVGAHDADGIPDRMVKFSRQAVIALLGGRTGDVAFKVRGEVSGSPFEGTDTIRVLDSRGGAEDAEAAPPQQPPPSAPTMRTIEYEVQPGDTLTDIAARFGTGVETLVRFNQLQDPNRILLGQRLKVPSHAEQQAGAITRIPG